RRRMLSRNMQRWKSNQTSFLSILVQGVEGRRRSRRCASVEIETNSSSVALGAFALGNISTALSRIPRRDIRKTWRVVAPVYRLSAFPV
ncbi:MAG: hypothetical protein JAY64_09615, partial [Candidatus Thiodiazotropha weberae]|nr:hypothetical protein [Candidatus Thiodiazotropha lotti]MCW4211412.1 hypothetical protein [Candidatus Thiodiazotropha lotti]